MSAALSTETSAQAVIAAGSGEPGLAKRPADRFALLDLPREMQIRISHFWSDYPLGLPTEALSRATRALFSGPTDMARRALAHYSTVDAALQAAVVMARQDWDAGLVEALLGHGGSASATWTRYTAALAGNHHEATDITTFTVACMGGNRKVIDALVKAGLESATGLRGVEYAITITSMEGNHDLAAYLLSLDSSKVARADGGAMALTAALHDGRLDVAERLLDAGAQATAMYHGLPVLVCAFEAPNFEDLLDLLVSRGADIDAHSALATGAATLLMIACGKGYLDVVAMLLDRGADVNARDLYGRTALTYAQAQMDQEMEDLLIAHGGTL